MVQFLMRENYKITTTITRKEMQKYEMKKPEEIVIEK